MKIKFNKDKALNIGKAIGIGAAKGAFIGSAAVGGLIVGACVGTYITKKVIVLQAFAVAGSIASTIYACELVEK